MDILQITALCSPSHSTACSCKPNWDPTMAFGIWRKCQKEWNSVNSKPECLLHAFCWPAAGLLQVEGRMVHQQLVFQKYVKISDLEALDLTLWTKTITNLRGYYIGGQVNKLSPKIDPKSFHWAFMPFIDSEKCLPDQSQSTAATGNEPSMRVMKSARWSHWASATRCLLPQQSSWCSSAKQNTFLCAARRNQTPAKPWVQPWGTRVPVSQASCVLL